MMEKWRKINEKIGLGEDNEVGGGSENKIKEDWAEKKCVGGGREGQKDKRELGAGGGGGEKWLGQGVVEWRGKIKSFLSLRWKI